MAATSLEKQAVLKLTPYFQDHWMIVDVGSNKGTWSDILIDYRDSSDQAGKYSAHLFEPYSMLLNYTRVKYDYNSRVFFHDVAIGDRHYDNAVLYKYGSLRNSGLSSLLLNLKWKDQLGVSSSHTVNQTTLDIECAGEKIDIIKIDIEGNEYNALLGAKQLLSDKRVKFIQIEYSEHYKLIGKTFKDVIQFIAQFGYKAYWYDGQSFVEQTVDNFVEDYRLENFFLTYLPKHKIQDRFEYPDDHYHYTQLWNSEFKESVKGIPPLTLALEIGAFEGLTTNYICDHMLKPDGRVICVDPMEDYYLKEGSDEETNKMFIGQYERFLKNTKGQPVELQRKTSREAFPGLKDYLFSFVYIDGDHREEEVYLDGIQSLRVIRRGGYILFDDYEWREETKRGIDRFLKDCENEIEVIKKGYQVLVRRR